MDKPMPPHRSVANIARELNKDPVDVVIDLALEKPMKQFFLQPLANENQDHVLEMMQHSRAVVTFRTLAPRYRRLWTRPCRPIC